MIEQGKRPEVLWTKPVWTHPKCNTGLHVFKKGSMENDLCYCKRKRLLNQTKVCGFIEGR